MTVGPLITDNSAVQPTPAQPAQPAQQQIEQEDQQQIQAEQETVQQTNQNTPDPNARVGSVIDTQV